ncbi:MAG: hypothetical protein N3A71_01010 [Candidatus Dojkabacteria bacterium]|nr:hypothetical protein [Candidatus Dojkabacteria bacterium]
MNQEQNENLPKTIDTKLLLLVLLITMVVVYIILFSLWYFTGPEDNKPTDFLIDNDKQGYIGNPLEDRLQITPT